MEKRDARETSNNKEMPCRIIAESCPNRRLRLWEIDKIFKCLVAGLCPTVPEQKQLLKKAYIFNKNKNVHYIHETLVACMDNENRLSRRMENLLNLKFGREVREFLELGDSEFMGRFRDAVISGNFAGALWAAAVRPGLPEHLKIEVFGEVHMALFFSIEKGMILRKALERRENEVHEMTQAVREATGHRRTLQKENERLKQAQSKMAARLKLMEKERSVPEEGSDTGSYNVDRIGDLERENESLKTELDAKSERLKNETGRIEALKEKNRQLLSDLKYQRGLQRQISEEARYILRDAIARNGCDETCPSFDLCKKRILMVGGITRMEARYKKLVESRGGVFEYYDGYMKKGVRELESRLKRADLVICPVNCNSHAACLTVKNLAKKYKKTLHMLANSSLSSISRVIGEADNVRASVN